MKKPKNRRIEKYNNEIWKKLIMTKENRELEKQTSKGKIEKKKGGNRKIKI